MYTSSTCQCYANLARPNKGPNASTLEATFARLLVGDSLPPPLSRVRAPPSTSGMEAGSNLKEASTDHVGQRKEETNQGIYAGTLSL